ncbi:MAG: hypothetical protein FWC43_14705 [Planctomycetaceae bacterium]|nr:hypothetical protein [Planctomycetaceae bacterium]
MQLRLFVVSLFAVCLFTGCPGQERPAGMPELFPCKITITQGGRPLGDAIVNLVPEEAALGWVINGITDANGVATIKTQGNYTGAPAGPYKVCVSKVEITPSQIPQPAKDASYAELVEYGEKAGKEVRPSYNIVKPEYNDAAITPLSITITKGKNNVTLDAGETIREEIK